jgi:subtilisin family serine protease
MKTVRNTLFLGSALALAACGGELNAPEPLQESDLGESLAPLVMAEPGKALPGKYIVVMKEGADVLSVAGAANARGGRVERTYTIIPGFAAELDDAQLKELRRDRNVAYVEQDAVAELSATQTSAPWNLDCIDQPAGTSLNGTYNYNSTASNVTAYIIDTGIYASHTQFGGRAANVYDALGGNGTDCNGHGTHVAGTVGSATYGVAKGVRLRGVRVLDCNGSGSNSGVIAGMDWVRVNAVKPAVANMSLGGAYSATTNTAANNLANSGVFLAVAAGNSNANACNYSPASASSALTVAALATCTTRASYSNYGSCVDIYAPGSSITSTWLNGGTNTIAGTSMASPHAAGVGALYKAVYGDAASSTVHAWIVNNAVNNAITNNITGTPNKRLYKGSL